MQGELAWVLHNTSAKKIIKSDWMLTLETRDQEMFVVDKKVAFYDEL